MKNNRVITVQRFAFSRLPFAAAAEGKPQFAEIPRTLIDYINHPDKTPADRVPFLIDVGGRPEEQDLFANVVFSKELTDEGRAIFRRKRPNADQDLLDLFDRCGA